MKRFLSTTTLVLCTLLLTGCSDEDFALLIDFGKLWAKENGMISIGARWAFGTSTGDPTTDAIVDTGKTIKGVRDADKKVDEANAELKKPNPDKGLALQNLDDAVEVRPKDWYTRINRAVLRQELGNEDGWKEDRKVAEKHCHKDTYCQKRQWQTRADLLKESAERQRRTDDRGVRCSTYRHLAESYNELASRAAPDKQSEKSRLQNVGTGYENMSQTKCWE